MECDNLAKKALSYLRTIIGLQLCDAIKYEGTDLYDFRFGTHYSLKGSETVVVNPNTYALHATCRFKIISKSGDHKIFNFHEDSTFARLKLKTGNLLGLTVLRVDLSDKNDLWIDLGAAWIVFATFENEEESWRFFAIDENSPHLVVSNSWLYFI